MPMLHSKLEVVGITFTHECSNSSPRYMVRTTMPSLCVIVKFPMFPIHKISITLLIISNMSGDDFHQVRYKITKSFSKHNFFHKEIIYFR